VNEFEKLLRDSIRSLLNLVRIKPVPHVALHVGLSGSGIREPDHRAVHVEILHAEEDLCTLEHGRQQGRVIGMLRANEVERLAQYLGMRDRFLLVVLIRQLAPAVVGALVRSVGLAAISLSH
jgi:hypothetical protein